MRALQNDCRPQHPTAAASNGSCNVPCVSLHGGFSHLTPPWLVCSPLVKDEVKEGEPPAAKKSKVAGEASISGSGIGEEKTDENKKSGSGDETADLQVEFAACLAR